MQPKHKMPQCNSQLKKILSVMIGFFIYYEDKMCIEMFRITCIIWHDTNLNYSLKNIEILPQPCCSPVSNSGVFHVTFPSAPIKR